MNGPPPPAEAPAARSIERMRARLFVGAALFVVGFAGIALRLVDATVFGPEHAARDTPTFASAPQRADIVDRNGELLATTIPAHALYADARRIADPDVAALRLAALLPDIDLGATARRLASGASFVWIHRALTPREAYAVNKLGEPGLVLMPAERRIYPVSGLAAHALGFADPDNRGLAGVEARFDARLRGEARKPLALSLDLRFQHVVHDELARAVARFSARGGAAVVLDADSAEVLAMVSLPTFDPNGVRAAGEEQARFNRATHGVFEMGSTFKAFTVAMALDSGAATLADGYDVSEPLRIGRFTIRDYHPENRWLSVPEIFIHSSNIGAARLALEGGAEAQRGFLGKFGMLAPLPLELPEVGRPLVPERWRESTVATVAFGHGIAVSPMHLSAAVAALVNGGVWRPPTMLARRGAPPAGHRAVDARTSRQMRQLFRIGVTDGTGGKADVPGYRVGGKTGTAEKTENGRYDPGRLVSSFVAAFPMDAPRFVIFALIDEPQGIAETHGYATGGWTAAPAVGRIVARIGPLAGIAPEFPVPEESVPEESVEKDGPGFIVSPDGAEIRLASY